MKTMWPFKKKIKKIEKVRCRIAWKRDRQLPVLISGDAFLPKEAQFTTLIYEDHYVYINC